MKKFFPILIIILLMLTGCNNHSEKATIGKVDYDNPESVYSAAQEMYDKKDIYNAIHLFERIPDYKDSQTCINEINCLIRLTGNYSMWNGADFTTRVYVTPKNLQISGSKDSYYSEYKIVKFQTNLVSSDDLCIYYPEFASSTGKGKLLSKGSEHTTLWEVTEYDENKNEFVLGEFHWLMSDSENE